MLFRVLLERAWGWGLALSSIGGDLKAGTLSTGAVSLVACGSAQQETRWQIASEAARAELLRRPKAEKVGHGDPMQRGTPALQRPYGALTSRNEL